jgi:hypothetical protein
MRLFTKVESLLQHLFAASDEDALFLLRVGVKHRAANIAVFRTPRQDLALQNAWFERPFAQNSSNSPHEDDSLSPSRPRPPSPPSFPSVRLPRVLSRSFPAASRFPHGCLLHCYGGNEKSLPRSCLFELNPTVNKRGLTEKKTALETARDI